MKNLYSVVVPLYNEELVLDETYNRLTTVLEKIDGEYEIILVNDGSRDKTEEMAKAIAGKDKRVKFISFSRNFGHQNAITAGMDHASGEAIVVIDADLQDPPELIYQMIEKYHEGYDVVYAVRAKRKGETIFKKVTAKAFYRILKKLVDIDIPVDTGDYRLISREVCNVLKRMREKNRFVRGMVSWIGFKQIGIPFVREERFAGETKYTLSKMIKFSLDGIVSFSTKPLKFTVHIGFALAILSFLYACYLIVNKLLFSNVIEGWTSMVVIVLFIGGIQMIALGIIGEYIARIYEESKNRPLYITKELVNFEDDSLKEQSLDEKKELAYVEH